MKRELTKKDTVILFYPSPWPGKGTSKIPYALLYLERMIKNMALNIIIIDEQCQKNFTEIINKYKNRILLAGVSSMTGYQINRAIKFSKKIKKMSGCLVIWGGWHPTLLPKQVL